MDLDPETGAAIEGWPHVAQSLQTILGTRINTRVFRREFGSDVPALVDAPMNDENLLALYVAVAEAIDRWEPRFDVTNVGISGSASGAITMTLQGSYRPDAHLTDTTHVSDSVQTIRVTRDRVDNWSLAA
ncbi:hypothetical protein FHS89_001786 [Rubricella aquisinus]|uniref:IraD/Gp25-like domain-containing protein n=1 Tax=Rubricella aquisinus TaxID=2028108 RepID=A0A840X1M8_9RHOB|nr:GPW/gp25 family protein [Rubricella aquisinus]MBB5515766.1 hypothetical protein [Rubricella aquisinus]